MRRYRSLCFKAKCSVLILIKSRRIAVECMKDYISLLNLTDKEKEELKQNHDQWAGLALKGIKQRLVRLCSVAQRYL